MTSREELMTCVPLPRQLQPFYSITRRTALNTAGYIVAQISLPYNCESCMRARVACGRHAFNSPLRTLPFAVFLKNFRCVEIASSLGRFRIVISTIQRVWAKDAREKYTRPLPVPVEGRENMY